MDVLGRSYGTRAVIVLTAGLDAALKQNQLADVVKEARQEPILRLHAKHLGQQPRRRRRGHRPPAKGVDINNDKGFLWVDDTNEEDNLVPKELDFAKPYPVGPVPTPGMPKGGA